MSQVKAAAYSDCSRQTQTSLRSGTGELRALDRGIRCGATGSPPVDAAGLAQQTNGSTLLDRLPCGVLEVESTGRIAACNAAYARMLGYDADDLLGRHHWEFAVSKSDWARQKDEFEAALRDQPPPVPWLRRVRRRDGTIVDVRIDWDYLADEPGRVGRMLMFVTDVGEQQDAERANHEAEERVLDFARVVSDRIWEMDKDLRFTFVSVYKPGGAPSAGDFLGKTRWEMAGCDPAADENWRRHVADLEARRPFRDFRYAT
ncbi:MAG: PAS domain-containing protein, partial [Alphaproteobacteria bacterium]|nr:PAS domain-containing protein [Alphaproteobacteria bacterium]